MTDASILEGLFKNMDGLDRNQPGYTHNEGWNAALRHAMDIIRANTPAPSENVVFPQARFWNGNPCDPDALAGSLERYAKCKPGGDRDLWAMREAAKWIRAVIAMHPSPAPNVSWRCFHCDQVMHTEEEARLHFGVNEVQDPACTISIERVRELELDFERHAAEDSDTDRAMHGMIADHGTALIREEEKGYARGLDGGRAERDRLIEVLRWYADEVMTYSITQQSEPRSAAHCDRGQRARAILKEITGE